MRREWGWARWGEGNRVHMYTESELATSTINRSGGKGDPFERTGTDSQKRQKRSRERGMNLGTRDPVPRVTDPLPLRPRPTTATDDQPRPKLKLPNLFDNLALMEPEPAADVVDAEPGASPGKFAVEFGGECEKCESLSGRDATPLNPCLTKCARCLWSGVNAGEGTSY